MSLEGTLRLETPIGRPHPYVSDFKVILGGGSQQLGYVQNAKEDKCSRLDGKNLTQVWLDNHKEDNAVFAVDNAGFNAAGNDTDYLLGIPISSSVSVFK